MLPPELISLITLFTGDRVVAWVLRQFMNPEVYRSILLTKRRILVYGQVQSGKTKAIMDIVKDPFYEGIQKIIVIQNSLLVFSQYRERLHAAEIEFQIVDKTTTSLDSEVIILMNNKYRYNRFLKASNRPSKYITIMDESDSYGEHPLVEGSIHDYYVTATPHHNMYNTPEFFHRIKTIDPPEYYQGLLNINIEYNDSPIEEVVSNFHSETAQDGGMMLINNIRFVFEMKDKARNLSQKFPQICFVTLNHKNRIYFGKMESKLPKISISKLIGKYLKDVKHIVFIANRMSLRGLSYVSSNYQKHLTHQYSDLQKKNVTNALQRMRIFGIYRDEYPVKLILPTNNYKKINKMKAALEVDYELNRWFVLA